MQWMCCAFQSFPAKILKLLCRRCAGSTVTPMLTNNDFLILRIFLSACLYPPECCLVYLDCKVFWDSVLFTSFTQFLAQWGLDQWVVLLSVTGITDKDSAKNSSSHFSSNIAVPVFDKLFGMWVDRKNHFLRTVGKNHLQDLSIVWMQGTQRQVSIWRCARVINLTDNQKNRAVNNDYKGRRREEIFCWVDSRAQWYIWVMREESLLFQALLLKSEKRKEKIHSTATHRAALCLHEPWAVHQSLCPSAECKRLRSPGPEN